MTRPLGLPGRRTAGSEAYPRGPNAPAALGLPGRLTAALRGWSAGSVYPGGVKSDEPGRGLDRAGPEFAIGHNHWPKSLRERH